MDIDNDPLIEAAIATFARYGVRKSTMSDIATAAGVSRQTLYNRFDNKDEVLRAAVNHLSISRIAVMQDSWRNAASLSDKIEAFLTAGPVYLFDLIRQSPEAADLVEGLHSAAKAELEIANDNWKHALADILRPHCKALGSDGPSAEVLADFLYAAAYTAKTDAVDRNQLLQRLAVLKTAVLALLGEAR